ncbi:N-acetylmuramic acid 6-phosphate etherase [Clostridium tetanomorphum]|uniref:N-acetylmuramic acid 6-phosphate etherase n=1 Tax=Clostridium tetanomorphum TaxID=1553 RepID=UPI00044B4BD7|nr:N-acetylmuramic acid 6-phosphate etherase [Clostridium tetanomorphum]KAJ49514.1 N-acetylmuramic acid-6-phosphate etherase [Clostridium tetanomorphum DSM 665]KAJ53024.1 N-acetylmuramic acid-6-phosphate etherase [Clostridium tetanomorphum DSM 665]MBP1864967.1 N-acetylmuramic acid 6-phosphate etherase [Clostridium tetanomorphum]NRS83173.1 N-acetylmuramic acid 6-phosphate etherase [Clostridium tetanomorphum]SQC01221.1 N-acetylmuramic acid-6-phosphate etherase [Clostridium tetanomorphum]
MDKRNYNTINLDSLSTFDILKKINNEDKKVAQAVEEELTNISEAVDIIVESMKRGGRMFYIGSGTSGKLGVIDASECPPTFGVDDSMIQGIISGGERAISGWLEHTEDNEKLAVDDINKRGVNKKDVLVGISASGNTPYVKRALEYGRDIGCKTIGVMCDKEGKIKEVCHLAIAVDVGPEVIMGSTRMKAGTAQKMILNMLSTTAMIKLGKTYSNLMVNVKPINKKLENRVKEIVQLAVGKELNNVDEILSKCNYDPKIAIVMIKTGMSLEEAKASLDRNNGVVYDALKNVK